MRRATVGALVVVPALAIGGWAAVEGDLLAGLPLMSRDLSGLPLDQRFQQAPDWDGFIAASDEYGDQWQEVYDAGEATVAPLVPDARSLDHLRLLVVAEAWCGDSRHTVPYLARLAHEAGIPIRIVRKRDAPDLLAEHPLPDGRQAVPLVLVLEPDSRVRGAWIEQPEPLRALIAEETGRVCGDHLHHKVEQWYGNDAGRTALTEILAVMRDQR